MGALALSSLLCAAPSLAQTTATITVSANTPLGTIPGTAVGVNTAVWDGNLLDAAVPGLLGQAGVTTLRFPGGSTSDDYHWQNNSTSDGAYVNPSNTFDAFMGVAHQAGAAPILTVNYGSNAADNGGGDPNEAAAWVDYANNTKRCGIKYWEIGNEIYGNGEYGAAWEKDLHLDHSPSAYGANVAASASAMKAKDPTVKVGAVLTSPGDWPDGQPPDWNTNVLAACGTRVDFVVVHWYAPGPGSESDSGLLSSASLLAAKVAKVKSLISRYCGANAAAVQIFFTETNSVSYNPGKQTVSLVNGLFAADDYMTWLENGVANVDWWDLHNGSVTGNNNSGGLYGSANYGDYGLLSSAAGGEPAANTPFAPYYGIQMLSHLGKPGDQMVSASSSQSLLAVHAVKQAGGSLALLLINKDPNNSIAASISVSGFTPAAVGTVFSYGRSSSAITSASGSAGNSFTQTVPPYSLTTVVLAPNGSGGGMPPLPPPPAPPTPPAPLAPVWSATAAASPAAVAPGASSQITAVVQDSGASANVIVDLDVYNSSGTKVGQQYFSGQFSAGASQTYSYNWTAPSGTGAYHVTAGMFSANWSSNLYWNGSAATISVAAPVAADAAPYNFESGTQGWASSGGMISGVSSSTAQAFAGTHSLAVQFSGSHADTQQVFVSAPATPAGKTVTFHVWLPSGSGITAVQPYVQQGSGGWSWTGSYQAASSLKAGAWNTLTVAVPANASTPLYQLGVQFFTGGPWSGTCSVDTVTWQSALGFSFGTFSQAKSFLGKRESYHTLTERNPSMNILRKVVAVSGLAAVAVSLFAQAPVQAQGFHSFRHERIRRAARIDRQAARVAARGNYRKAAKMRSHAYHLRHERYGL